jgi:hypothetical protein
MIVKSPFNSAHYLLRRYSPTLSRIEDSGSYMYHALLCTVVALYYLTLDPGAVSSPQPCFSDERRRSQAALCTNVFKTCLEPLFRAAPWAAAPESSNLLALP